MFKTEIEFSKNILYVTIRGIASHKNLTELKRKLYYILNEYGMMDIIIDVNEVVSLDKVAFYDMLDDYDIKFGGNLNVIE